MSSRIVLTDGTEKTQFCIQRVSPQSIKRWVACDAFAADLLLERDIPYVDEAFYLSNDIQHLKSIQLAAHALSTRWFRELPLEPDWEVHPAALSVRSFNYFFLSLFCAFDFLKKIAAKEAPCDILSVRVPNGTPEETMLPTLLDHFSKDLNFEYIPVDLPVTITQKLSKHRDAHSKTLFRAMASLASHLRQAKILFSGNPLLLQPVAEIAFKKRKLPTARIREFSRLKQMLLLFDEESILIPSPPLSSSDPSPLADHRYWNFFRERGTFLYDGIDFLPLVWNKMRSFFSTEAPHLTRLYRDMKSILQRIEPEQVVVDEDVVPFNRSLVTAAKNLGIKTYVISHGLPGAPFGFVPLSADKIAVWGNYTKQILEEWHVEPERIDVTGCPKYDFIHNRPLQFTREELCKKFGWDMDRPIALVIPGGLYPNPFARFDGSGSTSCEIFRTADYFLQVARETPTVNFIYKFRRGSEGRELFPGLVNRRGGLPPNLKWVYDGLALDYMAIADIVFNSCSSACLEAVLVNKPVVIMNFSFHKDVFPFADHGISASVRTVGDLRKLSAQLGKGLLPLQEWIRSQEGLIEPFIFSRDSRSAERISDCLFGRI